MELKQKAAVAAPVSTTGAPSADIQAVIAALKVELQGVTPDASSLVDSIDAQLRLNGALSDQHIAALEQALVVKKKKSHAQFLPSFTLEYDAKSSPNS